VAAGIIAVSFQIPVVDAALFLSFVARLFSDSVMSSYKVSRNHYRYFSEGGVG